MTGAKFWPDVTIVSYTIICQKEKIVPVDERTSA